MEEQKINYEELYPQVKIEDIVPVNNEVVIKKVITGVSSTLIIMPETKQVESTGVIHLVVNSADDKFKPGDRITVDNMACSPNTVLHEVKNPNSLSELNKTVKEYLDSLKKQDKVDFKKSVSKYNIVEYYIIKPHNITAIVKQEEIPIKTTTPNYVVDTTIK